MPSDNSVKPTSGFLRIALNMGNPILTASTSAVNKPAGLALDLGRALATRLGAEPIFTELKTAADCMLELGKGNADLSFMAIDPARAEDVHFSSPYVEISGAFAVRSSSAIHTNAEVDLTSHEIVVGVGSAYDLFLSRHLKHAGLHRIPLSEQVIEEMLNGHYTAAAGIRQQLEELIGDNIEVRILQENFMVIQQAIALAPHCDRTLGRQVEQFLDWARASAFIQKSLSMHGVPGARVALETA